MSVQGVKAVMALADALAADQRPAENTSEQLAAALRRCKNSLAWYAINAEGNSSEAPDADDVESVALADAALAAFEADAKAAAAKPGDALHALREKIEGLGYAVIIWSPGDFPSQEAFDENIKYVIDACVERGNGAIADLCPRDVDSEGPRP